MLRSVLWLTCLCFPIKVLPSYSLFVSGKVVDTRTRTPLSAVRVCLDACSFYVVTDESGSFLLEVEDPGSYDLQLSLVGYQTIRMPVEISGGKSLEIGILYMDTDVIPVVAADPDTNTADDLSAEGDLSADFTPLNALMGVYERRSAFNFSQAFYRYRGYDTRYREVLLNGMPMNELHNGRAAFNLWGGLNDVFRHREFVSGLGAVPQGAGGVGGSLQYLLDPALNRRGLRVSSSASNRGYGGRFMATWNTGNIPGRWAYSLSASRRWAEEGYVDGTLYDALSFFASVRYRVNSKGMFVVNALYAPQRRGIRPALTREVADLAGHRYNPYWGYDQGEMRNSRVKRSRRPLFMLNYFHRSLKVDWQLGVLYSAGYSTSGRLGYYQAPNPDPVYYRYLPSAQLNGGVINYENARLVREDFLEDPQLNWGELYRINLRGNPDGRASYVLYDDVASGSTMGIAGNMVFRPGKGSDLSAGFHAKNVSTNYYATIRDLLGATYHLDIDPYSETRNHLEESGSKKEGDLFQYHYNLHSRQAGAFLRYNRRFRKGQVYCILGGEYLRTRREGLYRNERYPDESFGAGEPLSIWGSLVKSGGEYRFNGRHIISLAGVFNRRIPDLNTLFLNPRENHTTVRDLLPEQILGGELRYRMDLPSLKLRTTLFYTGFSNLKQVSYYYLDGGVGSAFVQELRTGVEKRHLGGEFSVEYDLSSNVKADLVLTYGQHQFTSDPDISINFNTVNVDDAIDRSGSYDLGKSNMNGLYVSGGPQSAIALGVEYRAPEYWWVGAVASYLDRNFVGVSGVRRTNSFFTDPETGVEFDDVDENGVSSLLRQEALQPLYYLDLTAGKSWLYRQTYVSVFLSVNNLFNAVYETGGYEQNRTANYRDLYNDSLSGTPSFGNKYWYGSGRTFFLNLAVNF